MKIRTPLLTFPVPAPGTPLPVADSLCTTLWRIGGFTNRHFYVILDRLNPPRVSYRRWIRMYQVPWRKFEERRNATR